MKSDGRLYEKLYPGLKQFFGGYFHQDWTYIYDWQGEPPSFQVVVRDFKTNNSQAIVTQVTQELAQFIADHLTLEDDWDLGQIVIHKLLCSIYAPGLGLTYRQWLEDILTILKE
ncbi:hypothetical protein FJR38_13815 [Anabaena sp. UHCC 0253]|uniref:contact-dependent growth inhibition system immunity protein n=1 Tax=Anabaena sp. UHCC 0253 TaxID=2590019 RepID=UPI001446CC60|nr:contact-dependent growth inhibition system immunity protein [Anabaena sp. UHCC 0253]MTJ53644.1 hypothetical protein [Anabaena sp. UHCC 0253]